MKSCFSALSIAAAIAMASWMPAAGAASLTVQVVDAAGRPVSDAVVYAEPTSGQTVPKRLKMAEIEQRGRQFRPLVTVVEAGTDISFPNNDTVRHHVYSFSPAKTFELKLYSGKPSKPENFDKPGTVVLGCNIHDQMIAYVQVVATPYFAKTDASGQATLGPMVPGKYALKAWHYSLPIGAAIPEQAIEFGEHDASARFALTLKSVAK